MTLSSLLFVSLALSVSCRPPRRRLDPLKAVVPSRDFLIEEQFAGNGPRDTSDEKVVFYPSPSCALYALETLTFDEAKVGTYKDGVDFGCTAAENCFTHTDGCLELHCGEIVSFDVHEFRKSPGSQDQTIGGFFKPDGSVSSGQMIQAALEHGGVTFSNRDLVQGRTTLATFGNDWNFIALVVRDGSRDATVFLDDDVFDDKPPVSFDYFLEASARPFNAYFGYPGLVDNLFLFDSALSADQIGQLAQHGAKCFKEVVVLPNRVSRNGYAKIAYFESDDDDDDNGSSSSSSSTESSEQGRARPQRVHRAGSVNDKEFGKGKPQRKKNKKW